MQIAGRSCESCGATVQEAGGDGCGSCDVVMCAACLESADRCPKCHRSFDETRDVAAPPEDHAVKRGRSQAVAVAFTVLGALVLLGMLSGQLAGLPIQLLVFGLLFIQFFRGRAWARWGLVILTGIVALAHGAAALGLTASGQPMMISIGIALVFAWSALILALSRPLARYLRAQRAKSP